MLTRCRAPSGPASRIRPRCGSRSWTVHCLPSSTTTAPGDRSSTAPPGLTAGPRGRQAGRPSCRPAAGTCRCRAYGATRGAAAETGHRRAPGGRGQLAERPPARSSGQQRRPQDQRIRQRPPLRRHRVHGRQGVVPPPPDDRIPPPARQGELCRRGERLGVLLPDQVPGPDVDQPGTRPRHRQEIRSVLPPLPPSPEPEPQRGRSVTGLNRNRQIGPRDTVRPELPAGALARDACHQASLVHGAIWKHLTT